MLSHPCLSGVLPNLRRVSCGSAWKPRMQCILEQAGRHRPLGSCMWSQDLGSPRNPGRTRTANHCSDPEKGTVFTEQLQILHYVYACFLNKYFQIYLSLFKTELNNNNYKNNKTLRNWVFSFLAFFVEINSVLPHCLYHSSALQSWRNKMKTRTITFFLIR